MIDWKPILRRLLGHSVRRTMGVKMALGDLFEVECYDREGNLKWRDTIKNLVVNTGLDDALDKYLKGSAYTAAHYCGLTDGTPTFAPGDTMASHAGWTEVVAYSEATREVMVWGSVSAQSVDNSASKASFSITGTATIGGAFLSTDSTKSGSSGTLYGGGAFTGGDKPVVDGYTLNVTVTASSSAS